jgi:hypothetical protein
MKDFNLHFKNGKKELKLDIQGMDNVEELKIIAEMVKSLNISMRNQVDYYEDDKVEALTPPESLKNLEEGYQALEQSESSPKISNSLSAALINAQKVSRQADPFEIQKYTTDYNVKYFGGNPHYQVYYICPICHNKGKRFIPIDGSSVHCHGCNHLMYVQDAHSEGFPKTDVYDNFFVAGDYIAQS